MDKKRNDFKLPVIQTKGKDSSKLFANSFSENNTKVRPASLKKVEDLQRKLFSKLDAYQGISTKAMHKKAGRKSKVGQAQNTPNNQTEVQGYQKMQKLMPGLYNKLVQAKKSTFHDFASTSASTIQTPSYKSQQRINQSGSNTSQMKTRQQKISLQQISKEQKIAYSQHFSMTEEEMNSYFSEYSARQNLGKQTSFKELQNLGQDLSSCQKQIYLLTKSMQGLIKQVGMECLQFYERQDNNNEK